MSYGKFTLVDLFCGCGGMTRGFTDTTRFKPIFANDFNADAVSTYKANFDPSGKHTVEGDIISLLDSEMVPVPFADVVIGGPPCQGFSLLNKKKREGDPRRRLWVQYFRAVELSRASVIVMENVPELLTSLEFEEILTTLYALNFKHVVYDALISANYGVPEIRKRAILMASKTNPISLPRPTHINPKKLKSGGDLFNDRNLQPWTTVKNAIGDLPRPLGIDVRPESPPFECWCCTV